MSTITTPSMQSTTDSFSVITTISRRNMGKKIKKHQREWIENMHSQSGVPCRTGLAKQVKGKTIYSPLGLLIKTHMDQGGSMKTIDLVDRHYVFDGHTEYLPSNISDHFDLSDQGQIEIEKLNIRFKHSFKDIAEIIENNPQQFFN